MLQVNLSSASAQVEKYASGLAQAHAWLQEATGLGNDFVGWVNLPRDYDKAEYARIQAAAKKIQSDSKALVVIGIGGSYLGARAVIEMLESNHYNLKKKNTPNIYFAGNGLSGDALQEIFDLIGDDDFSVNVISKSGTTTEPAVAFRFFKARLEEMYGKAVKLVNQRVQEAGEQASFDAGIHDLHPELVNTLGRLRYRTSFGQNVLNHSLEVAYLASVMASELGLDPIPVKRAGLLHDLGKAVDHEVEGSHAVIGADLARRFGERPEIVHAIEAHHNDIEPNSVIDVLIQAADAVSAARPGARKETLDAYIKRLEKLEEIANAHAGVERTYAIQAGREVRVMVKPEVVDEAASVVLAHDIAQQIENEMQYPGQVKVVVIRESRAVDYAK